MCWVDDEDQRMKRLLDGHVFTVKATQFMLFFIDPNFSNQPPVLETTTIRVRPNSIHYQQLKYTDFENDVVAFSIVTSPNHGKSFK